MLAGQIHSDQNVRCTSSKNVVAQNGTTWFVVCLEQLTALENLVFDREDLVANEAMREELLSR